MLKVISLDLWDTIIEDREDLEEKRGEIRIKKLYEYLSPLNISYEEAKEAYNKMSEWLFSVQRKTLRSINTEKQICYFFKLFEMTINEVVLEDIKNVYETAIFDIPPPLIDGVEDFIKKLKDLKLKLCILSDAGRTPGWALREILKRFSLLDYFDKTFFSDEIGFVKPNKKNFQKILDEFNVEKKEVLHIGDNFEKDIIGAKNFGINYIHFTKGQEKKDNFSGKNFDEIYKIILENFSIEKSLF
ncbi:MAG: HAD family hydrolase [Caldisericia bacterium]|nr:HAD family hydrolase [Caldisericia bacterium]